MLLLFILWHKNPWNEGWELEIQPQEAHTWQSFSHLRLTRGDKAQLAAPPISELSQ